MGKACGEPWKREGPSTTSPCPPATSQGERRHFLTRGTPTISCLSLQVTGGCEGTNHRKERCGVPERGSSSGASAGSCRRVAADNPLAVEEGVGRKGPGTGQGA